MFGLACPGIDIPPAVGYAIEAILVVIVAAPFAAIAFVVFACCFFVYSWTAKR